MSSNTVEAFLYHLQHKPGMREEFAASASAVLDRYPLTARERTDLLNWDVRALGDRGVSQMLLMLAYCDVHGMPARLEYVRRMLTPATPARSHAGD